MQVWIKVLLRPCFSVLSADIAESSAQPYCIVFKFFGNEEVSLILLIGCSLESEVFRVFFSWIYPSVGYGNPILGMCQPSMNWVFFALYAQNKFFEYYAFVLSVSLRQPIIDCDNIPKFS